MRGDGIDEARELIELCLGCKAGRCRGICQKYREARAGLGRKPKRPPRLYEMDGQRKTLREWGIITGIPSSCLYGRLKSHRGMTLREAIAMGEAKALKTHTVDGETLTKGQWADRLGLTVQSIHTYASRHKISFERAVRHYLAREEE